MQKVDPQMAGRVWGRVQACQHREEMPPPTIRVVQTPKAAWKGDCPRERPACRKPQTCTQVPWIWLIFLWVLCCGKIC